MSHPQVSTFASADVAREKDNEKCEGPRGRAICEERSDEPNVMKKWFEEFYKYTADSGDKNNIGCSIASNLILGSNTANGCVYERFFYYEEIDIRLAI